MSKELRTLAEEIEYLVTCNFETVSEGSALQEKYNAGLTLLEASFGKGTKEYNAFRHSSELNMASTLRHLAEQEEKSYSGLNGPSVSVNVQQSQTQLQTTAVVNEITMQILLNIDHSGLQDSEKREAKELVEQVKEEVEKAQTNWDKVTNLLRRSFDYGLKIAPDVVKLADAYYKAKGGA